MSEQTDETTEIEAEGGEAVEPAAAYDDATLARRRAALAQIVQYGDPVLKSRASEVTEFDEALAEEIQRMIVLMREGLGVGLAATQVGKLRRLLVFQTNADAEPQGTGQSGDRMALRGGRGRNRGLPEHPEGAGRRRKASLRPGSWP